MILQETPQLRLAYDFILHTHKNVFLTGKAGTGKTTFLKTIKENSPKRMVVVAPTGVAAINAGGVTIHSFFQLPFGPHLPSFSQKQTFTDEQEAGRSHINFIKFSRDKINLIKSLDLLVIDEISMVRADLLDAIDEVLRRYRDHHKPFGGVQLLLIGDLHQLTPVVKEDEWRILRDYYDTVYFFSSKALQLSQTINIELRDIFRQSDAHFIDLLNQIRNNDIDEFSLAQLNERCMPHFRPDDDEGYIILTTHNDRAQDVNQTRLKALDTSEMLFVAEVVNDFPKEMYPTEADLVLKIGAQVMFIKNDSARERLFYNGKIGKINSIDDDIIYVRCQGDHFDIPVKRVKWDNIRYHVNETNHEIEEEVIGTFTQYPLKLAWAITIHKSQGLTFDRAIIDARFSFAYGQVYVALSRCRSLDGLVLSSPIVYNSIRTDETVSRFNDVMNRNQPDEGLLSEAKADFQKSLLTEMFDFEELKIRFYVLRKLVIENQGSLVATVLTELNSLEAEIRTNLSEISDKFRPQLESFFTDELPVENNLLQDRVKKACNYFYTVLNEKIKESTSQLSLETDSKSVKKIIGDAYTKLQREIFIRLACLKSGFDGFETLKYLHAKSNADMDFKEKSSIKSIAKATVPKSIAHRDLYEELNKWRNDLAGEMGVPPFMVLPYKVLAQLATYLPLSSAELEAIRGLGKAKIKQYGEDILQIIEAYCIKNKPEYTPIVISTAAKKEKKPKPDTRKLSKDLYIEGNSIDTIAKIRGFSRGTIEGHLAYYVGTGELDVYDFVDREKVNRIIDFYEKNMLFSMSEAKNLLGDTVSYADIRFVLKHLDKDSSKVL